ncbi:MAG: TlpA family protein disulfide reductase, partial [Clostridiales bacterium]|nr:TlpA family protein disulfide reductase [Clostridiales bacterium]
MRIFSKLILILAILAIVLLAVSAYQQGNNDASIENNTNNGLVDSSSDSSDDGSEENYEKLDIDPKVTVRENMDYIKIDKPSVDFELEDLNGNKVKLSDYKGQLVFLNFWATWCPPCREEMPDMEAIHQQYGDKGVVILGVSSTQLELRGGQDKEKARQQVKDYIDKEGFTFSIPIDSDNKALIEYNNIYPITGIPTTFM